MIWAALAMLGVPIWLVVGALAGAVFSRHHFKAEPGVVPLLFREAGDKWPRRLAYGRYVHNVLIVNHGLAQIRTSVHVVEHVDRLDLGDTTFKHIDDAIAFALRLDNGSDYELALERADTRCHYRRCSSHDPHRSNRAARGEVMGELRSTAGSGQQHPGGAAMGLSACSETPHTGCRTHTGQGRQA